MTLRVLPAVCAALLPAAVSAAEPAFEIQTIDPAIGIGYGLAIGDVNGDGKPDILLADAQEIVWYANGGTGAWKKKVIARRLTAKDNVCIAARDLDGDGRVEIAVGAQWNPGETNDAAQSGAVFWLQRPADGQGEWKAVALPHEPTVHRMHFVKTGAKSHALVVLPLHGRGNRNGEGENGVKILAYQVPGTPADAAAWSTSLIDGSLHVTHNFDLRAGASGTDEMIIGSKEAPLLARPEGDGWLTERLRLTDAAGTVPFDGIGEIRWGRGEGGGQFLAAVEPFHGPRLAQYAWQPELKTWQRTVLDASMNQAHALACGDLLGAGSDQIVAGWREPDAQKQTGVRLYRREGAAGAWKSSWLIDGNRMACEDLKVADLDGDGRPEVIAAGRATKNVIVCWNRSSAAK